MRPLTLHTSALNDAEYAVYIACLRDLAEDDESGVPTFHENINVSVREARAWLRGRYSTLAPNMIDSILRLFCPALAPADVLTGGQLFAVLRLVHHVLNGKDVDKGLVFVQVFRQSVKEVTSQLYTRPPSATQLHAPGDLTFSISWSSRHRAHRTGCEFPASSFSLRGSEWALRYHAYCRKHPDDTLSIARASFTLVSRLLELE